LEAKKPIHMDETPIKITKVCANDSWPLIYLPKEAIQRLGLKRGTRILISIDGDERLIIRPIK